MTDVAWMGVEPRLNLLSFPQAVKPGSDMPNLGLSQDQINALVAYLESLK